MNISLHAHARSICGRRRRNEDACLLDAQLGVFAVLDGMGGYTGGAVASKLGAEAIGSFFAAQARASGGTWPHALDPQLSLAENRADAAVRLANRRIHARREGENECMGSTVALLSVSERGAVLAHVGDSRIYRLRGDSFEQLTQDHSLYEHLREGGVELPPLEDFVYANVITKALGPQADQRPTLTTIELLPGDRLLLCTDGLSGSLDEGQMAACLRERSTRLACDELVAAAYAHGSKDNITAIVVAVATSTAT